MKAINNFVKVIVFVILGLALACGLSSCSGIGGSFGEEPEVEINCPNSVHEYVAIVDAHFSSDPDDRAEELQKWQDLHKMLNNNGFVAYRKDTARVNIAYRNDYYQDGISKSMLNIVFEPTSLKLADMEKALKDALRGYNYDRLEVTDVDSEAQPEVEARSSISVKVSASEYCYEDSLRNIDVHEFEEWFSSRVDEVTWRHNNWWDAREPSSMSSKWQYYEFNYEYEADFTDGFKELYPNENLENIKSDILAWFAERGVIEDCVKITFGKVYFYN